jgi:hypothetical protein
LDHVWFWTSYVMLWMTVAALGAVNVALFRQLGQAYLRTLDGLNSGGLELGDSMDDREAQVGNVGEDALRNLTEGAGAFVLLFVTPECTACRRLLDELRHLRAIGQELTSTKVIVMLGNGAGADDMARTVAELGWRYLTVEQEAFASFRVQATPFSMMFNEHKILVKKGVTSQAKAFVRTPEQPPFAAASRDELVA